jgi:hypothetical protein
LLTDSDAKSMKNTGSFEPYFNVQTTVHKLIVTYDVVNDVND